jgi:hypothetical protein
MSIISQILNQINHKVWLSSTHYNAITRPTIQVVRTQIWDPLWNKEGQMQDLLLAELLEDDLK